MSLEAVYYVSQVVAAFALIASLIFVGVQLRLSRKMERASAQREVLQRVSDWLRMVYRTDNDAFDNFVIGMAGYNNAPPLIRMHMDKCLSEFVFVCESALNMHKDGFFSEGTWFGIERNTLGLLLSVGGAEWWEHGRLFVGKEIVDHLDNRLAEIRAGADLGIVQAPTAEDRLAELLALGRLGDLETASLNPPSSALDASAQQE